MNIPLGVFNKSHASNYRVGTQLAWKHGLSCYSIMFWDFWDEKVNGEHIIKLTVQISGTINVKNNNSVSLSPCNMQHVFTAFLVYAHCLGCKKVLVCICTKSSCFAYSLRLSLDLRSRLCKFCFGKLELKVQWSLVVSKWHQELFLV